MSNEALLRALKARFEKNMNRHKRLDDPEPKTIDWEQHTDYWLQARNGDELD